MRQAGFKPTTPVLEWANTVHALDRAAAVIGLPKHTEGNILKWNSAFSIVNIERYAVSHIG
jgi:hypothetical protein